MNYSGFCLGFPGVKPVLVDRGAAFSLAYFFEEFN